MDCNDIRDLIHPYLDDELEPSPAAELSAHLRGCESCSRRLEELRALGRAVRGSAPRYAAPTRLRTRILESVAAEAEAQAAAEARVIPLPRRSAGTPWRPLAMAASLALAVVTSSGITAYVTLPGKDDRLVQDVISGHVRSLMADHLTDVRSSDQHTVKPWFNGRPDLSPPVDDLAGEGYPLVGGRIDYIEQRPVAALVYRHRQHPINLFVLPAGAVTDGTSESFAEHGYNVLHWRHGDLSLWAVSDLNLVDLRDFQRLYEAKSAASPDS